MELTIELSPEAEQDLNNYYLYYEDKMIGLGERFLSTFEQHLQIISCYPAMRIRYADIRCVPLHGFPFMIHFSVIENRNILRVHAVIHTSQNPTDHWDDQNWIIKESEAEYNIHTHGLEYLYFG